MDRLNSDARLLSTLETVAAATAAASSSSTPSNDIVASTATGTANPNHLSSEQRRFLHLNIDELRVIGAK
jgi:hypothetical protein